MKSWARPDLPQLPGQGPAVQVWDTATGSLQIPVTPGNQASLYVCGITPYDSTHMGHAATYLAFDLLQRAWADSGCSIAYTQNITDIDDPLLERASKVGRHWQEIAESEMRRFSDDMTSLRLLPPTNWLSVTEHMSGIIDFISRLQERGVTYSLDGDLYFDVASVPSFGGVSKLPVEQMLTISAERGGDPGRPGKRNPLDALLWLAARPGEPAWDSPFGAGRPGWHVECLAIATDTLSAPISVQGGGSDLVFPHHEYCAAESAAAGHTFASAYVHAGMVGYEGEKMSKSRGNLVFVSALRAEGTDPMVIRAAILNHHYRSDWEWSNAHLELAANRLDTWKRALSGQGGANSAALLESVRLHLAQDLNSPAAMQAVDDWAAATLAGDLSDANAPGLVARTLDSLLGIAL